MLAVCRGSNAVAWLIVASAFAAWLVVTALIFSAAP